MRKLQTIALAASLALSLAVAPSAQANAKPKAFNGKTCRQLSALADSRQ